MIPGLAEFLLAYPGMAIAPSAGKDLVVAGQFSFSAEANGKPLLQDTYELRITIPAVFPKSLPRVEETGGKIPRDSEHHVNSDASLCLGSPLRLMMKVGKRPDLIGFAESCIIPFLYAMTHQRLHGGALVFNELAHGATGALADYAELFRLHNLAQTRAAWYLLSLKPRRANKLPCPCGCGRRVGRCSFNARLHQFRAVAPRAWFKSNSL